MILKGFFKTSFAMAALAAGGILNAQAVELADPAGDTVAADCCPILDIRGVQVEHDDTAIAFTITLDADIMDTSWGYYLIGIDASDGGDTRGNGGFHPIRMSTGMDHFVSASWDYAANRFAAKLRTYDQVKGDWSNGGSLPVSVVNDQSLSIRLPRDVLGLSDGGSLRFDVYSSNVDEGIAHSALDAVGLETSTLPPDSSWAKDYNTGINYVTYEIKD